jgi:hypothetical protein
MLAPPVAAHDLADSTSPGLDPVVPSNPYPRADVYLLEAHDPTIPSHERSYALPRKT